MAIARGNRKAQLLKEAMKLFSAQGYDKVTVKQLGDICGITEPAVYRHYQSKEALYDAVLESVESRLDVATLAEKLATETDPKKFLQKFGAGLFDIYSKNKDICRILLYSALKNPAKGKRVYSVIRGKYEILLAAELGRLNRARKIGKRNFAITAQSFVGMVYDCSVGQTLWRKNKGRVFKANEVLKDIVPIYVKGLGK